MRDNLRALSDLDNDSQHSNFKDIYDTKQAQRQQHNKTYNVLRRDDDEGLSGSIANI